MNTTIDISKRTNGEWEAIINHARYASAYPRSLIVSNHKQIANCYIPKEESNISTAEAEANAAFIVTACNNYDKLVEALKDVVQWGANKNGTFIYKTSSKRFEQFKQLLQSIEQDT